MARGIKFKQDVGGNGMPALPKKYVGKEFCQLGIREGTQICVKGVRYGFIATLVGRTGQRLPISLRGEPRTPRAALKAARAFVRSVAFDSHGNPRR